MHLHALICGAAATFGTALAQGPDRAPRLDPIVTTSYSEARSRSLFLVIDADADDRLDLFEAAAALGTVGDDRDLTSFRRVDANRDGFVHWREFDRHLRAVMDRGRTLRIQPARPWSTELEQRIQPLAETPGRRTYMLFDADRSGSLSRTELAAMAERIGLPDAVRARFTSLDRDHSGEVSLGEFAPWAALLPPLAGDPPRPAETIPLLPPRFGGADADGDGRLGIDEMRLSLRRLDPALGRWAETVVRDADRDGDGALGLAELRGAAWVAAGTTPK